MALAHPARAAALAWAALHPDETHASVQARFGITTPGLLALWISREKAGHKPPPAHLFVLPEPAQMVLPREVPKKVLDRHRALIDKQLTFLEDEPTGSKEYLNVLQCYRGMLADWQSIPQIDEEKATGALPDLSTAEGRAQVAAEIAALPEGLLQAAIAQLRAVGAP